MKDEEVHGVILGHRGKIAIIKDFDSGRFYEGDPALAFIKDIDVKKHIKAFKRSHLRRV